MAKLSKRVSKGLGSAIKEAKDKINGTVTNINDTEDIENTTEQSDAEALLNTGVKAQKKRRKGTKTTDAQPVEVHDNSLFEALDIPEEGPEPQTFEEFCEREFQKAKEKGLPEPDFDFRNFYERGQTIFFVHVLAAYGTKEIINLKVRTVYPRMIVGTTKAGCYCISYNERDQVFFKHYEAEAYAATLNLTPKYTLKSSKSASDKEEDTDDRVEDENSEFEANTSPEEVINGKED